MNPASRPRGVYSPVVTPFSNDLQPDHDRFLRHCRWLIEQDVGLAVFGTNSEANSLSVDEKKRLLDTLVSAGLPVERMMPGTGCSALTDSVELTRHAIASGCRHVLMLPPFYYKGVSDDGIFRSYAEIIERVGSDALRIYVYHIPQVSQVALGLPLIDRLLKAYPRIIAGVKDSGGDWDHTQAMLERFQPQGFDVFAGNETFLLATMRGGGAGCITATGNVNPAAIVDLYRDWQAADADARQQALDAIRAVFAKFPMIPALKGALGIYSQDEGWGVVRPPLVALNDEQRAALKDALANAHFAMPGIEAALA
ncbi:4-hydroxy-tetrahydrodipicolinate synthase [Paraburkholderia graminis C4D1M]|uniref:Dihydrodipicolinate synthetase n=1 Tax=Paraburkholderia graminis (strain ATCC 700544 / DSM 17151 / LMG 18924 / NCIMB 13744 / C4D1M) TaxID=396598 RepID=B1G6J3_PARG4|nr:dihydrodipicolinate synthase family protein [Paraburkholderia graminis]EDT08240.1 dihydrodipicolinate synthetase [Paraburkholderia graminis C4D1M]CAB3723584.1 4-hydroxy-tetrahydrodipicolinate synthase [Paraburkholderia graminis C4D1M]